MRKLFLSLALGTLTVAASLAGPTVQMSYADEHDSPLAALRGKFAGESTGFTTVCVNIGGWQRRFTNSPSEEFCSGYRSEL